MKTRWHLSRADHQATLSPTYLGKKKKKICIQSQYTLIPPSVLFV